MLELLLSEQCPLLQVCVCVCVCVCVSTAPSVCVSTAPSVCVCTWMGQIQRTYFTASYTLYNCVYEKKETFFFFSFLPIMVKCLNIGKNIGKPIYRSISSSLLVCMPERGECWDRSAPRGSITVLTCSKSPHWSLDAVTPHGTRGLSHTHTHTHTHTHRHNSLLSNVVTPRSEP